MDLAHRFLACRTAIVSSFMTGARIVRAIAGDDTELPESTPCLRAMASGETVFADGRPPETGAYVAVPLRLAHGLMIGTLCVIDEPDRSWTEDDRALLEALASHLIQQIDRDRKAALPTAESVGREPVRLTAVLDHGPALVFERRKVDSARSTFTFFGARKAALPGIRELTDEGETAALDFIEPADRDLVRAALVRSVLEETDLELTFRIKGGNRPIRWLNCQMLMRRDEDGTVVWDGVTLDITDLVVGRDDLSLARIGPIDSDEPPFEVPTGATGSPSTPVFKSLPRRDEDQGDAPVPRQAGGRILLADDLDLNRRLIADMLSIEGHVVDCVADGAAAVAAARATRYDLILMDMIMPGMDGLAATLAIRAMPPPIGTVPIVALTANSYPEQLESCIAAGMNATLTKPMSLDSLITAVHTWMRRTG